MASNKIPEYRSTTLVQHLADSINKKSEIKYCFILGAGASRSSGISTGYELAKKWFEDIKRIFPDYQLWVDENKIDEKNIAKHYGKIYKKRFEINPIEGYEFMQTEMANSSPSFGYSILSQLLETQHNVVITTNFDALVEDALFLYSKYKPLVCGHESLSEFVKPVNSRPVIIKVHRDLLLHPKNEDGELLKLEEGFANSLDRIFQGFTPIVIGYAGNDLSLMNYMNGCNSIKNIFWCRRTGDVLSDEINRLLESKNGKVFDIAGFDEIMFQIYAELYKEKELDQLIKRQAEKKANEWSTQIVELSEGLTDKESNDSLSKIVKDKVFKNWLDARLAVNAEKDVHIKNEIYLKALTELNNDHELFENYAIFLKNVLKDYDSSEKYYLKALELYPGNPTHNSNYALFLKDKRKDFTLAEKYYIKALELQPSNGSINNNYALFLKEIRKDYESAEKYHLKSLELNPNNSLFNNNYAVFLQKIKNDFQKAELFYKKALECDGNNGFSNCGYAVYLKDVIKDYDSAEYFFLKAIDLIPSNSNFCINYANFLSDSRKDFKKAEYYFLKGGELDNLNPVFYGNYALFLKNVKKEFNHAEEFFLKAIELDSTNGAYLSNYSNFLKMVKKDYENARNYALKSIEVDQTNPTYLTNYANLLHNTFKEFENAEEYYKKSLELDSTNTNSKGNYAQLLINRNRNKEALVLIKSALFEKQSEMKISLKLELYFYCFANFYKEYSDFKLEIEKMIEKGERSEGWDFSINIEKAKEQNHPEIDKVIEYAEKISGLKYN